MAENKEVTALENVMMSFAFADSDEKLQRCVDKFLPGVLGMLRAPSPATKAKLMEVLTHISKRIKVNPAIIVPVDKLGQQFLDPNSSTLQKSFLLVYIQMGFPRLEETGKKEILRKLMPVIGSCAEPMQDILLSILLVGIQTVEFPRGVGINTESQHMLEFLDEEHTSSRFVILEFFLDVLLSDVESYSTSSERPAKKILGMSARALKRLNSLAAPKSYQELNQQKLAILKFMDNQVPRDRVVRHAIVSGADVYTSVSEQGDNMFRASLKHIDLESEELVKSLFQFFEGTPDSAGSYQRSAMPMSVKVKILSVLVRSKRATNMFPSTLKAIFDCAYGAGATGKSQQIALEFARWVLIAAEEKQIRIMGPAILSGVFRILRTIIYSEEPIMITLRASAFGTIPLICKRLPALFGQHLELVEELFGFLAQMKESAHQIPVSEALCSIANALSSSVDESSFTRLHQKIEATFTSASEVSRYVGLYFATHVFPFSDATARYACCLASIEPKSATRDLALRGLQPYRLDDANMIPDPMAAYPPFFTLVSYLTEKYQVMALAKNTPTHSLPFDSRVYGCILVFLREVLTRQHELKTLDLNADYSPYLLLVENALQATKLLDLHKVAAKSLTQIFSVVPSTAKHFVERLDFLWPFLFKGKPDTREAMAKAIAIVLEFLSVEKLQQLLTQTLETVQSSGQDHESLHGAVTILGMIGGRCVAKGMASHPEIAALLRQSLSALRGVLQHKNHRLVCSACSGIGSIARYNPLPLPRTSDMTDDDTLAQEDLLSAVEQCLSATDNQVVERAVQALSDICLGDHSHRERVIASLYQLGRCKHEEVLFTVGEAFSCLGSGWNSTIAQQRLLPNEPLEERDLHFSDEPMESILTRVVKSYVLSSQPDEQVAGSIWLLSLAQFSGKHPQIQKHIESIQRGFTFMLSSPNEVIQEVGSRGLVLVYEHGTADSQKKLVSSLVSTLSTGGKTQVKHTGTTQLFPEGYLGKKPGDKDSKLTTYQELSSLASELGKPELMYKFMNLASHHQMWSSRKGAAFAATALASSEAKEQLREHLPSLVPKLYRSSYDPNPRLAQAMNNVLKALLADNRSLDPYWDGIVAEVLEGMGSRQWRVRQASCAALADGLSGRSFKQITDHLEQIYYMLFRVIDDIKESVATEALKCSKTLTRLSIQLCDPEYTSEEDAKPALAVCLQFLLEKGLVSEAKPVQLYSLDSILKLCKAAKHLIAPHVPNLMYVLLENLSFFEPQEFNYLQQKTEEYGITKDALETARLAFSNSLPMNETLDVCASHITTENVREVCSKLFTLIGNGVGLPTQAGTAKFLANITRQHPDLIKRYAGKLIMKLVSRLGDPSTPLRKLYAATMAHLAYLCSTKSFEELLKKLKDLYFSEDTSSSTVKIYRNVVGVCFLELAARAARRLAEYQVDCIPLVFFATCDTSHEDTRKLYETVWVELGGYSSDKLYVEEIFLLVEGALQNSSWIMKQQGFLVLKKLADRQGKALTPLASRMLQALLVQLKERRIWTGKEDLFPAIASVCTACKDTIEADNLCMEDGTALTPHYLIEVVLAESKRSSMASKEYQRRALSALGQLLETFCPPLDMFATLFPYIQEVITSISEQSSESHSFISSAQDPRKRAEEEKEASLNKARNNLVQAEAFRILGAAWPVQRKTQETYVAPTRDLLLNELKLANWNAKLKILGALEKFVERLSTEEEANSSLFDQVMTSDLLQALGECVNDPKYNVVRETGLKVLKTITQTLRDTNQLSKYQESIVAILSKRSGDTQTQLLVNEVTQILKS